MYHPIYPTHKRPLVVRTGVDYRFTTIAVDMVDAVDGRYEVLFLGTGTFLTKCVFVFYWNCVCDYLHTYKSVLLKTNKLTNAENNFINNSRMNILGLFDS